MPLIMAVRIAPMPLTMAIRTEPMVWKTALIWEGVSDGGKEGRSRRDPRMIRRRPWLRVGGVVR
jgi:hypothetical protein